MNFEDLLSRAAEPTLQDLVGRPGVRLLASLDSRLTQPSRLREVALGLTTPQEMLFDSDTRRELLSLLPRGEAERLAAMLELDGRDPYAGLMGVQIRRGSKRAGELLGFFGLVELEADGPPPAATTEEVGPSHPLFPHQRRAADRVLDALREEPFRVLLHMPTGAGKTRTAMHVIARLLNSTEPMLVIWLAHSEELCEQAAGEFRATWAAQGARPVTLHRWWGEHDLAGDASDGLLIAGLGKAFSASQRSVETIGGLAGRARLIVIDEAHQAVAPSYQHVLDILSSSGEITPLLGLTATPGRTWNDLDEDARLGDFFYRRSVQLEIPGYRSPIDYLVDEGYLARTTFVSLNYTGEVELSERDLSELADSLDVPASIVEQLAMHEQRNLVIINRAEAMSRQHPRLLIFAATVEHAVLLATVLRARGLAAQAITGTTPSDERARIIEEFRSNDEEPRVLVNYGVLTAGFDAPRTSGVIIARPTTSLVLYSQMVGRATRGVKAGGNAEAEVITVVDTALPGFASLVEAFHNWEDIWQQTP